ncbi:MAG: glycoside hydrolase family 28 protein [Candidatus Acidiferrales bacterium]
MAAEPPAGPTKNDHDLGARTYNIRDYGAKGDGRTLDTAAVQAAIDACNKDQGGTVLIPAGVFVIGTVELKSNVRLHLAAAGKLLGSADGKQYHAADAIPLRGDATLEDGNVGLLYAVKAENITIDGAGTIDGQGAQFHSPTRGIMPPAGISGNQRPYHLLFYQCKNLNLRDIFLYDSAYHSVRVIQSSFVKADGLRIYNRVNGNNDGFHFISSQYVAVSNCTVQSQDDACALFGSCKYVTIANSSFSTRWSVFRFGGGQAENITISNCIIYQAYGCPIKIQGGPNSRFENLSFSDLIMNHVTGPISIGVGARRRQGPDLAAQAANASPTTPAPAGIARNISFRGIRAIVVNGEDLPDVPFPSNFRPGERHSCIDLNAINDGVLENISFNDCQFTFPGGGTAEEAALRDVPKVAGEYFEIGVLPAYAVYARNVRGLNLSNVRFGVREADLRPAMVFDHVQDATINGFGAEGNPNAESLLRFIDTHDVLMSASRVLTPAQVFLQVEGGDSKSITVDGGDLSKAGEQVAFRGGASKESVKLRA